MGIERISAEVTANILSMSEIEHDGAISDADKASKLASMKSEVLEKINSELANVTIAAQKILQNIRSIVESEEWAKLPEPKKIANEFNKINEVALALQSIESQMTPDIQALMSFYLEIMKRWAITLLDTELIASTQQWEAIKSQKKNAVEAAEAEKVSGIISGAVGICTAALSIAVKLAVMKVSATKYKENKASKTDIEAHRMNLKNQDIALGNVDLHKQKIANLKLRLKNKVESLNRMTTTQQPDVEKIAHQKVVVATGKKSLRKAELEYKDTKQTAEMAMARSAATQADMDAKNNKASRLVQKWRSINDIVDSVMSIAQHSGTIAKSFNDKDAALKKIASDMDSFMVNFLSTVMQAARKDMQDVLDGQKSCISNTQAMVQALMSAESYAIKAAV